MGQGVPERVPGAVDLIALDDDVPALLFVGEEFGASSGGSEFRWLSCERRWTTNSECDPMTDAIETVDLTYRAGRSFALDRLSIRVRTGAIYGFLGPNGAGKTTTIRLMLGLLRPAGGGITVLGEPVPGRIRHALGRIGYVPERPHLHLSLTVEESVRFHAAFYPGWDGAWAAAPGVVHGAFLAFYAFIGFEDMVNVAEEVVEPGRTMRRAIVLALAVATGTYLLVAAVAVDAVPPTELAASTAPLALVWSRITTLPPAIIALVGLFAVVNGALVQIIMASRIFYGMSRQGWLPAALGRVHPRRRTPIAATALVGLLVFAFAVALPIVTLAGLTSLLVLVVFTLMHLALLALEARARRATGRWPRRAWIPAMGAGVNVAFLVAAALAGGT